MSEQQWSRIWPEMPNKERVFRNPADITTYDSVAGPRYQVRQGSMDGAKNTFNASEWDIEIKFTPKKPTFEVGERVSHVGHVGFFRILAINGNCAWVSKISLALDNPTPFTVRLDDLGKT